MKLYRSVCAQCVCVCVGLVGFLSLLLEQVLRGCLWLFGEYCEDEAAGFSLEGSINSIKFVS